MPHRVRSLLLAIGLGLAVSPGAHAFSLIGPYESWMQTSNDFRHSWDIGGPMNLGEEYRWNVPVLTYAFDPSFLDYFGSNGVYAVEQAIQILNALLPASQLHPTNYPTSATLVNYQAQANGLVDLKSSTLGVLLEQLGLAQPARYTFNVHTFAFDAGNPVAQIVQRNFDPINLSPTNRVNGTPFDYILFVSTNGQTISVIADEILVDPLDSLRTAAAENARQSGEFFTGLTRDDVGGLQYLLRTNNSNFEILLPGVYGVGTNTGSYANQTVRCGVDKITFVRHEYDGLLGQFFTPYTNQFTDYYVSNNAAVLQQLERVVAEPDILFLAGNGQELVGHAQVNRTGTTNWWRSPVTPGGAGPGLIRPPIKLTFSKPAKVVTTEDISPGSVGFGRGSAWGSFDQSTNPPVVYPLGDSGNNLTLNLHLMRNNAEVANKSWQLSLGTQESIVVQTSTNLNSWLPHLTIHTGGTMEWIHYASDSQRYFRIVPNN
jgi:hypothetical protein